jgi:hypothetical protein
VLEHLCTSQLKTNSRSRHVLIVFYKNKRRISYKERNRLLENWYWWVVANLKMGLKWTQILWTEWNSVGCAANLQVTIFSPDKSRQRHITVEHQIFDCGTKHISTATSLGFYEYSVSSMFGSQLNTNVLTNHLARYASSCTIIKQK